MQAVSALLGPTPAATVATMVQNIESQVASPAAACRVPAPAGSAPAALQDPMLWTAPSTGIPPAAMVWTQPSTGTPKAQPAATMPIPAGGGPAVGLAGWELFSKARRHKHGIHTGSGGVAPAGSSTAAAAAAVLAVPAACNADELDPAGVSAAAADGAAPGVTSLRELITSYAGSASWGPFCLEHGIQDEDFDQSAND